MVFVNKTCKKVLALAVSVLMVVGFVSFVDIAPDTASAATSTWNESVDTSFSGSGTAGNPYVISSAAELAGLASLVNNNSTWSKNKHFVLTTDIDLGSRERYEVYDDAPQRDFLRKVTGAEWANGEGRSRQRSGVYDEPGHRPYK